MECVGELVREASRLGAQIVCFPESYVPGYRCPDEKVIPHSSKALQAALEMAEVLARDSRIAVILPMDWDTPEGIQNVAAVISADGELLGCQTKEGSRPCESDEASRPAVERAPRRGHFAHLTAWIGRFRGISRTSRTPVAPLKDQK